MIIIEHCNRLFIDFYCFDPRETISVSEMTI